VGRLFKRRARSLRHRRPGLETNTLRAAGIATNRIMSSCWMNEAFLAVKELGR